MKFKQNLAFSLSVIILLFTLITPVSATPVLDEMQPNQPISYLTNANRATSFFSIQDTNNAIVEANYHGNVGLTTGATIEMKLQRKVLLWWTDVEEGSWTTYLFGNYGNTSQSLRLSQKGEYRAIVTFTIRGNGGEPDEFTNIHYETYN